MAFSNVTKNTVTVTSTEKTDAIKYILTDALDFCLVGSSEDMPLIWGDVNTVTNITKNYG